MARATCPNCHVLLTIKATRGGCSAHCPECGARFLFRETGDEAKLNRAICSQCHDVYEMEAVRDPGHCSRCGPGEVFDRNNREAGPEEIPVVTTETYCRDGHSVHETIGIATARVVYGVNILKDIAGSVRDFVGGRSASHEKVIEQIEHELICELQEQAFNKRADAVVRARVFIGDMHGRMLYGTATGTLVSLIHSQQANSSRENSVEKPIT